VSELARKKTTGGLPVAGRTPVAQAQREWLRGLAPSTGKSLSAIADEIGVARSTLTKKLRPTDEGVEVLHATIVDKIVTRYSVPPPAYATAPTAPPRRAGLAEDAAPYVSADSAGPVALAVRALVGTRRNADPWVIKTRALEGIGYLPGDVVIVDLNAVPRAGDAVCAQVIDWPTSRAETVMRLYQPPYLVAASFDRRLLKPLLVEDDRVIIKGVLLPHRLRTEE
jgi:hypothetical protein